MLRHPDNTNLHLHREDTFEGLPVMVEKGPFVRQYLSRLKRTIDLALSQYSRVLALEWISVCRSESIYLNMRTRMRS